MKVYIVLEETDNGQQFEDYRTYTQIVAVFNSKELAEKYVENAPKSIPTEYGPVMEYADENNFEPIGVKLDENGEEIWEPLGYCIPSYNIIEEEILEQLITEEPHA